MIAKRIFYGTLRLLCNTVWFEYFPSVVLCGIIAGAACLALIGITHGFPVIFHADENGIVKTALRLPVDKFDPHAYYNPALTYYLLLLPLGFFYVIVSLRHGSFSPHEFALFFFEKPHLFFLSTRIFTVCLLCASIVLLFRLVRSVGVRPSVALCTIACFAFNPAVIENHHYTLTDSTGLLCSIATFLYFFTMQGINSKTSALFGLCAGLAISAKYNYMGLLGMYIFYCLIERCEFQKKIFWIFAALATTAIVFAALNPYIFIRFTQAIEEIKRQSQVLTINAPCTTLRFYTGPLMLLSSAFNPLMVVCMIVAFLAALIRPQCKRLFCVAVYVGISFFLFARHNWYGYIRYFFPLFPALFLLMAVWIEEYARRSVPLNVCAIVFLLASSGHSAFQSIQFDRELLKPNLTAAAHAWITANIEPGAKILSNVRRLQIPETPENLKKRLQLAELHKTYKQTYYRYQYEAALRSKTPRYNVQYFYDKQTYAPNTVKLDEFYATEDAVDKSDIIAHPEMLHDFDYIIATPDGVEGIDLNGKATEVARFGNTTIYKILK